MCITYLSQGMLEEQFQKLDPVAGLLLFLLWEGSSGWLLWDKIKHHWYTVHKFDNNMTKLHFTDPSG